MTLINEESDSKMFYQLQIARTKVKVKSWVKPQSRSEKSNKIFTRHLGDQILKFLSPTEKITHICKWVTGYLQPCLYQVKLDRLSIYIINYDVESVCENSQVLRVKYVQSLVLTKSYVQ